jgi:hypothetical protein
MNDVVYLSNVTPGPACSIPEEKKIFRVSGEDTAVVPFHGRPATGEEGALETPPLPVPHMYSA